MDELNWHAIYMQECWGSLGSPMEIKSILGLMEKYSSINAILENETYDNPSLNVGLFKIDEDTLD